jgi:hypothetical protein
MNARRIDLVVLDPGDWYSHTRRGAEGMPFALDSLVASINVGLMEVLRGDHERHQEMSIRFERFGDSSETQAAASEIFELFGMP